MIAPQLHEVTRSRIGIPASARAKVAALIQAELVPAENKFPVHQNLAMVLFNMFLAGLGEMLIVFLVPFLNLLQFLGVLVLVISALILLLFLSN